MNEEDFRQQMRALRGWDQAAAPSFDRVMAKRVTRKPQNRIRALAWIGAAACAMAVVWLTHLLASFTTDSAAVSLSRWRSPTAVLMADYAQGSVLTSWTSPTTALGSMESSR